MINSDSIIKIVEKKYAFKNEINGPDIYPLLGSIISSSPIDADRMDYLLRDSYFSGVKYGIYDYGRLLMSFIPVKVENSIYMAYKESGMDSILEFANARSGLYSQVYFHKTNRALSAMLDKACSSSGSVNVISLGSKHKIIDSMKDFYLSNPDKKFLEYTLKDLLNEHSKKIIDDIVSRNVWKKIYEKKHTFSDVSLSDKTFKKHKKNISSGINSILEKNISGNEWTLDFQIEDNFKDIDESQAKIIKKQTNGKYQINELREYDELLQPYHHVKFFIRVFVSKDTKVANAAMIEDIVKKVEDFVKAKITEIQSKK